MPSVGLCRMASTQLTVIPELAVSKQCSCVAPFGIVPPLISVQEVQETVTVEAIIEKALKFNPRRDPKILRRSLMHALRQQPDGTWRWKYDAARFQKLDQEAHRAERAKLADGLQRIACPTMVVRGGDSDVFNEEDGIRLAERLPNGRFVTVPRAGHTVQGDNPKDLVAELRRFLAGDN